MWWITGSVAPWTIKWQRFCWTVNRECISTCARRQCRNSSRNIPPVEMTIIRFCLALSSLKNGSGLILSQPVVPRPVDAAVAQRVTLTVYTFNPLEDPRWAEFVHRHPRASVFHTPGWLEALRRTYGYEPVTYTTTPPGSELTNGVVLCRVYSRITGRRMVSLPFSDHCEPLVERPEDLEGLLHALELDCTKERWKYVEIRPRTAYAGPPGGLEPAQAFYFHAVDLNPELTEIFHRCHK